MKSRLLVLSLLSSLAVQADTIELRTGERIDGSFRGATSAGIVMEVGGQSITLPVDKVRAIYFASAPAVRRSGVTIENADTPEINTPEARPQPAANVGSATVSDATPAVKPPESTVKPESPEPAVKQNRDFMAALAKQDPSGKPQRQLTQEEMQAAYSVSVNRLLAMLKAPATARFSPIEQASFRPMRKDGVEVRIYVDAQNSFGAMLRQRYMCVVSAQRSDGLYKALCIAH